MMAMAMAPVMAMVMATMMAKATVMAMALGQQGYCKFVLSHKCTNENTKIPHSCLTHSATKNGKKRHPHTYGESPCANRQSLPRMHMGVGPKNFAYGLLYAYGDRSHDIP